MLASVFQRVSVLVVRLPRTSPLVSQHHALCRLVLPSHCQVRGYASKSFNRDDDYSSQFGSMLNFSSWQIGPFLQTRLGREVRTLWETKKAGRNSFWLISLSPDVPAELREAEAIFGAKASDVLLELQPLRLGLLPRGDHSAVQAMKEGDGPNVLARFQGALSTSQIIESRNTYFLEDENRPGSARGNVRVIMPPIMMAVALKIIQRQQLHLGSEDLLAPFQPNDPYLHQRFALSSLALRYNLAVMLKTPLTVGDLRPFARMSDKLRNTPVPVGDKPIERIVQLTEHVSNDHKLDFAKLGVTHGVDTYNVLNGGAVLFASRESRVDSLAVFRDGERCMFWVTQSTVRDTTDPAAGEDAKTDALSPESIRRDFEHVSNYFENPIEKKNFVFEVFTTERVTFDPSKAAAQGKSKTKGGVSLADKCVVSDIASFTSPNASPLTKAYVRMLELVYKARGMHPPWVTENPQPVKVDGDTQQPPNTTGNK